MVKKKISQFQFVWKSSWHFAFQSYWQDRFLRYILFKLEGKFLSGPTFCLVVLFESQFGFYLVLKLQAKQISHKNVYLNNKTFKITDQILIKLFLF